MMGKYSNAAAEVLTKSREGEKEVGGRWGAAGEACARVGGWREKAKCLLPH